MWGAFLPTAEQQGPLKPMTNPSTEIPLTPSLGPGPRSPGPPTCVTLWMPLLVGAPLQGAPPQREGALRMALMRLSDTERGPPTRRKLPPRGLLPQAGLLKQRLIQQQQQIQQQEQQIRQHNNLQRGKQQ